MEQLEQNLSYAEEILCHLAEMDFQKIPPHVLHALITAALDKVQDGLQLVEK